MTIIVDSAQRTPYSQMLVDVRRDVPQIVDAIAVGVVAEVVREFMEASHCWRARNLTLLATVAGQAVYTLAGLPTEAALWKVHEAWCAGQEVAVLDAGEEDEVADGTTSDTYRVAVGSETQLLLAPAPMTPGKVITGGVSFVPSDDATGCPSILWRRYRRGITSGVIARLVLEPNKPWTNPAVYSVHREKFEHEVAKAASEAGPVRATPRRVALSIF